MSMIKLGYFVVERLAEPLSDRLERYAARSVAFRAMCVRFSGWVHNIEYQKALRRHYRAATEGGESASELPPLPEPLTEREATTAACEILGEGFVWTVGLGLLLHQSIADQEQEAAQQAEIDALKATQVRLAQRIVVLESQQEDAAAETVAVGVRRAGWWAGWRR